MTPATPYADLPTFAAHLRAVLDPAGINKKCVLLYAYNGTGKTRLSMAFKDIGKLGAGQDTLYFNAFTEDLFSWDNDLDGDADRKLKLNKDSKFFDGLKSLELDNRIRPLLQRYADFDFVINALEDSDDWHVRFSRTVTVTKADGSVTTEAREDIKISRGEENIFIWCFFLAIAELAIATTDAAEPYSWVKHIYIDDPISSLDEHNAISVACHIAAVIKGQDRVKVVISTHHTLFFNALYNELGKNPEKLFVSKSADGGYLVRNTKDTPTFYHVANLAELKRAADSGAIYTHHFNLLRSLLEKAASFHGLSGWKACLQPPSGDNADGVVHERLIALLNHGGYSLFEPVEMVEENKTYFRRVLDDFLARFPFNPELFEEPQQAATL
jgi:AAA domain